MTGSRPFLRPYAFEIITIANFLILLAMAGRDFEIVQTLSFVCGVTAMSLVGQLLAGVIVRTIVLSFRGGAGAYLRVLWTRGWLTDSVRLIAMGSLLVVTYGWIKLLLPVYHPRLYDAELWRIDQALFFGYSPTVLVLNLFSSPTVLGFVDWSYAKIFLASMIIGLSFFLSHPSRRLRAAFMTGNSLMWLGGAWLYMLVPSLGPAFRFPEVWIEYASGLKVSHTMQVALMHNYQTVLKVARGAKLPIVVIFGVAAFPSLHVATQTFVLLWMRRLWIYGEIVFGVFLIAIFLGSLITGWHYLIDSIAGVALAAICYAVTAPCFRIRRWLALRALESGGNRRISMV